MEHKTRILKLDHDDPQKELEFEVSCELEIPPEERLDHWHQWNIDFLKWMEELHGHEDTSPLIKRPSS